MTFVVLFALVSLGLRSLALVFYVDKDRGHAVTWLRLAAAVAFLALGALYAVFTASVLTWNIPGLLAGLATAAVVGSGLLVRRVLRRSPSRPGTVQVLVQAVLLLSLLLTASLTLMRAGFLALTTDRPVLLIDVTGETGSRRVRWAPADQEPQERDLVTHRVVLREPAGRAVGEAWIYGDQVAVKGQVLRLSPLLNAAGVTNLFELLYVHNGYMDIERHRSLPRQAEPLEATGPLAVHPWWRSFQRKLLARWESGTADGSYWAVRSTTTESTYFPLVDDDARPVKRTYRLVMTPGGLSAS